MQKPIDNQAIYHTWILVVLWVFQLIVEITVIGVNAIYIAVPTAIGTGVTGLFVAAVASLVFGLAFLISHIVQIVFYARRSLTPHANFAYDCTRFVIWTIVFVLNIIGIALAGGYVLSLIFAILVWILYLLGIIYASILFHRQRHGRYDNLLPISLEEGRLSNQRVQYGKQNVNYQNDSQSGSHLLSNGQQYQERSYQSQQGLQHPQQSCWSGEGR